MRLQIKFAKAIFRSCIGVMLTAVLIFPLFAVGQAETIEATARGPSTQMGKTVSVKVIISQFSTSEDREAMKDAFQKGGNKGLVDALSKMKSSGRIQIPGTVGYDLAYVTTASTPRGDRHQ